MKRAALFALLSVVLMGASDCSPKPTKAVYSQQRKTPFFRVLVYELLPHGSGGATTVLLFEDEGGTCYVTSGTDGGVVIAPVASCTAAKNTLVEVPK